MVKKLLFIVLLLGLVGCNGTGFERKTSLLPDEFSISSEIDPTDDWKLGPELKIGFKWKFK